MPSLSDIRSVLIVKPSSLGDIVHTLPSVHLLKRSWPHLSISWIVNTEWSSLLAGNHDLDNVVLFPRNAFRGVPDLRKLAGWQREVNRIQPDLALDFQGLMRSAMISKISGARYIHCLGDAEILPRLLSHRVVPAIRSEEHAVTRYLRLIEDLGINVGEPLAFPLPAGDAPPIADLKDGYLLVHPFSRGKNKSLSPECLERMIKLLAPIPIVIVGRSSDSFPLTEGCVNLLNKTSLSELIWLIRHAAFTLSVDSGPMHIAAAITSRVLGIHHWTNPLLVGPCNPGAWVWKDGKLRQMKEISRETEFGSRAFGLDDVEPVVELLKHQLRDCVPSVI